MEQNQSTAVSQSTALHLCFWLGLYGAHDFYAGNTSKGVVKLILAFILPPIPFIKGTYIPGEGRTLTLHAGNLSKKIYGFFWPSLPILAIIAAVVVPKLAA